MHRQWPVTCGAGQMRTEKENLQAFWSFHDATKERLDQELRSYNIRLREDDNALLRVFREDLADLNEGGKMLRGILVILGCRIAMNAKSEKNRAEAETCDKDSGGVCADSLALAFEMFQTGVLVHDDIIDRAETRRGKQTIQKRYLARLAGRGTKMVASGVSSEHVADSAALCAGDFGLYAANLLIAESYENDPRLGQLIMYFDETVLETIRGELLDVVLPYELQDLPSDEERQAKLLAESVHDIYRLKTARYSVVGPLHLGMLLGGASHEDMRALDLFAEELGVAFQIQDDILGIFADSEVLGKDVGSDISEYKQTILYMYVRSYASEYVPELLLYYGKQDLSEEDLSAVRRIFRESGALAYAKEQMNACYKRAEKLLSGMTFVRDREMAILRGLIAYLKSREK